MSAKTALTVAAPFRHFLGNRFRDVPGPNLFAPALVSDRACDILEAS